MKRQYLFVDNILSPEELTHTWSEDTLTLLFGTLMISFGIILSHQAGILTGGTADMAFLIHYAIRLPSGVVFFVINLLFCWLSAWRMGAAFMLKTFCVVGLVPLFSDLRGYFIHVDRLDPYCTVLFDNIMVGIGFMVLFRHKASLGGVNILALHPQDKNGVRAGKFQMMVDACIVTVLLWVVSLSVLLISILGAVISNLTIAMNHRPRRYVM